jgi:hypothetical protein
MARNRRAWCLLVATLLITPLVTELLFHRLLRKLTVNQATYASIDHGATRSRIHALLWRPWPNGVCEDGSFETWKGWGADIAVFYGPDGKVVYKAAKNRPAQLASWTWSLPAALSAVLIGVAVLASYNKAWWQILGIPFMLYLAVVVGLSCCNPQIKVRERMTAFEATAGLFLFQVLAVIAGVGASCFALIFGLRALFGGLLPLSKTRVLRDTRAQVGACLVIVVAILFLVFTALFAFDDRIY